MSVAPEYQLPPDNSPVGAKADFAFAQFLQSYARAIDGARCAALRLGGGHRANELSDWADRAEEHRKACVRAGRVVDVEQPAAAEKESDPVIAGRVVVIDLAALSEQPADADGRGQE